MVIHTHNSYTTHSNIIHTHNSYTTHTCAHTFMQRTIMHTHHTHTHTRSVRNMHIPPKPHTLTQTSYYPPSPPPTHSHHKHTSSYQHTFHPKDGCIQHMLREELQPALHVAHSHTNFTSIFTQLIPTTWSTPTPQTTQHCSQRSTGETSVSWRATIQRRSSQSFTSAW